MAEPNLNCPKCGGAMEDGFVVDYTYGAKMPSKWVEGEPVKSFWSGTLIDGKTQITVKTYRCTGCGYLESYAMKPVSESDNPIR